MSEHPHILLATLGGQPQVVTFTLDLLLQRFPITEVHVLHPRASTERLQRSLTLLRAEFTDYYPQVREQPIHFRSQLLRLDGEPIDDIADDQHADGTQDTIHQLIVDLKRQGYRIHLSVSGGRRLISLLAISVAALNFDHHDHIWHIYTPEEVQARVRDGVVMHVPDDTGVKLITAPFISLGAYISKQSSFREARDEQRSHMATQERKRCDNVWDEARAGQRKVLQAFGTGLRPQQVATQLALSPKTVNSHKTVLLQLCRNAWSLDPDEPLDYHFLHLKFAHYFGSDD